MINYRIRGATRAGLRCELEAALFPEIQRRLAAFCGNRLHLKIDFVLRTIPNGLKKSGQACAPRLPPPDGRRRIEYKK
jgi:hypothetical protein